MSQVLSDCRSEGIFIARHLLEYGDWQAKCENVLQVFGRRPVIIAIEELRRRLEDAELDSTERGRIQEIVGTLDDAADSVFFEGKQTAKFGRTAARPVTLAQTSSANSNFTFSSKGKSRLTGITVPQDTLRDESARVEDEIMRRVRRRVVSYLGSNGDYDPETRQLSRNVTEILRPKDYRGEIISKIHVPFRPKACDDVGSMQKKVCSILESLRKSLEGSQAEKTFFEVYCSTFPRSDPCGIKESHDSLQDTTGAENMLTRTALPRPHGIVTSYKIIAEDKEEKKFYSLGECQLVCAHHGDLPCSCPIGQVSIVVTKVNEPTEDHIMEVETCNLTEEDKIAIPSRSIQVNQTLQWPEKMLRHINETRAEAQEREDMESAATKKLQEMTRVLDTIKAISTGLSKRLESPQIPVAALKKFLKDFEENKLAKVEESRGIIDRLCVEFLGQHYDDRCNKEASQVRDNARILQSQIVLHLSNLYGLLRRKQDEKKQEEERREAARIKQIENTPSNVDPMAIFDLTDCIDERSAEGKSFVIRAKAFENAVEVESMCSIRGRIQDDKLRQRLGEIEKRLSFAGNLSETVNKIFQRYKASQKIKDNKEATNASKSKCNGLLKKFKASLRKRQHNAKKRKLQEEDVQSGKRPKSYRT